MGNHAEPVDNMDLHCRRRTSEVVKGVAKLFVLLMDEFVRVQVSLVLTPVWVRKLLDQLFVYLSAITLQPNRAKLAEDFPI